jgi:hypothetical protein
MNTWAPDSAHFVYTNKDTNSSHYADKDDGEVLLLPAGSVQSIHFADAYTYIYLKDLGSEWEIAYANLEGTHTTIARMPKSADEKYPGYSFVN